MSDSEEENTNPEELLKARQRTELKDLIVRTQQLKKSVNKDKKKRKEVTETIVKLEKELSEKHKQELEELNSAAKKNDTILNGIEELKFNENNEAEEESTSEASGSQRRVSKAEKRRQKKAEASKQREALIVEAEKNNKFCARNVEVEKIKTILKERNLKMFEINPDGNCLYASLAHQLGGDCNTSNLRLKASNFIRDHSDDFAPFLTDPKTGDLLTPEQFDDYCHQLISSPVWGGQPELRALSQALQRKIEVLQADCAPLIFGEEYTSENALILTFYRHYYGLGEHYNSVTHVAPNS